jgi:hypothetical protein
MPFVRRRRPDGSDADCIAALRSNVDQLNTFLNSRVTRSARRQSAPAVPVDQRVDDLGCHTAVGPRVKLRLGLGLTSARARLLVPASTCFRN